MSDVVLVVDFGTTTSSAAIVADGMVRLVREPASGSWSWPSAVSVDNGTVLVGTPAVNLKRVDPAAFRDEFKRDLGAGAPLVLAAKTFRPEELVAELLAALRRQAERVHGAPIDRVVLTIPAGYGPRDPRRAAMLTAGELAGFAEVELLAEPVAATLAPVPGEPFSAGDVVLVYDFGGGTFDTAVVQVGGDGTPEVLGHAELAVPATPQLDRTISGSRGLLHRLGVSLAAVTGVVMVGGSSQLPPVPDAVARVLGRPLRRAEDPALAVVHGAAVWALAKARRVAVSAVREPDCRLLSWDIPGGRATFVRWLAAVGDILEPGTPLAVIRLGNGSLYPLTSDDQPAVLVATHTGLDDTVRSGDRLASVTPPQGGTSSGAAQIRELVCQHKGDVRAVRFSPDGHLLATASWKERSVVIWDTATGNRVRSLPHDGGVHGVAYSPDGRLIATGSGNAAAVWDSTTGDQLLRLHHHSTVWEPEFSPDGQDLATSSSDRYAAIWNATTGRRKQLFEHRSGVNAVAFSPDGRQLATATEHRGATVWDVRSGLSLARFRRRHPKGGDYCIEGIAFHPDGKRLAIPSFDHTTSIWEISTGRTTRRLRHNHTVRCAAFSPSGRLVATGGADKDARIWDVDSGRRLHSVPHDDVIADVTFSPDGRWLATACWDGIARVIALPAALHPGGSHG